MSYFLFITQSDILCNVCPEIKQMITLAMSSNDSNLNKMSKMFDLIFFLLLLQKFSWFYETLM